MKRKLFNKETKFDLDSFLKICKINLEICSALDHQERCLELLARTNQFNISGRNYDYDSFKILLEKGDCFCFKVTDKFGDYGIVGFFKVVFKNQFYLLTDFVMSCRVAEKRIEETILNLLFKNYSKRGDLRILFIKTGKNEPIFLKFQEIGFIEEKLNNKTSILYLKEQFIINNPNIINLTFSDSISKKIPY